MPAFERAFAEHDAEIAAIAGAGRRADLRQHHRARWSAAAGCSTASPACSSSSPAPTPTTRCSRSSARSRRSSPPALERHPAERARCSGGSTRCTERAMRLASTPSRRGCSSATTPMYKRAGAGLDAATKQAARRDHRAAGDARHHLQPERARRRAGLYARRSRPRRTSPACRISCAPRRASAAKSAACRASTSSRCRGRASSRSCNSPRAATCAKRRSAPGSRAATSGGTTDNKAIIAETVALRAERAKLLGYETFAHYRLDDAMAKTPAAVRDLLDRVWAPARARALADRDAMQALVRAGGRQFRARAVGLALLRREAAQGPLRHRRGDDQAVFPARPHDRGGVLHRPQAVRADASSARKDVAGLAPRRAGLGGARPDGRHRRPVLRRLFRALVEAQRRLDDHAARPGEADRATSARWSSTS